MIHVPENTTEYTNKVRDAIESGLLSMVENLNSFEQTTHSSLYWSCPSLGGIIEQLVLTYNRPGAHSISELVQRIERFCKR